MRFLVVDHEATRPEPFTIDRSNASHYAARLVEQIPSKSSMALAIGCVQPGNCRRDLFRNNRRRELLAARFRARNTDVRSWRRIVGAQALQPVYRNGS